MDAGIAEIMDEFFAYDRYLPLNTEENQARTSDGESDELHVTFSSVRDQRVPALLTLPEGGDPPHPVVIILHGVLGHKTSPNQIKRSRALTASGYATLRIDGQYRGAREVAIEGGLGLEAAYYYRNRDAMIQTTVDLMRGADYLASRGDIDMSCVGFAGFSMGGGIGAVFCALDSRVKAVALGITGGDFDKLNIRLTAGPMMDGLRRAYTVVDPVNYIGRISPRPLLMINAADDDVVPKAATEALFKAARDPKRIVWYDCGHADLPDEYLDELTEFFGTELA